MSGEKLRQLSATEADAMEVLRNEQSMQVKVVHSEFDDSYEGARVSESPPSGFTVS